MPVAGSSGLPRPVHWRELPPGSRTLCPRSPPHPPSPPGTFQGPPSVVPPPAPPAPALSDPSRTGRAAGVSQSLPGADPEAGRASAAPRWSLGRAQYDVGKAGFTARHLPPELVQGLTSARLLLLPECRPHGLPSPPPHALAPPRLLGLHTVVASWLQLATVAQSQAACPVPRGVWPVSGTDCRPWALGKSGY